MFFNFYLVWEAQWNSGLTLSSHSKTTTFSAWSLQVLFVPAWAFSGYSDFIPQSKEIHVRLTGDSKLSVSVNCCLSDELSRVYLTCCPSIALRPLWP